MPREPIVSACVLIIGNEILSGRTQDANLAHLAKELNERGIQVREARVIPDIESIIVETLNECRAEFDYVFTTGGIGPTHDDITAECVAKAFGKPLYTHPEIEAVVHRREAPAEVMAARMRMARVPEGAALIENPFGPHGFRIENVFVMAGIPVVMRAMLETAVRDLQGGKPVRSRSVSAFVTEGQVASKLSTLQEQHPDVDIGSYPFTRDDRYGTSLVVRGTEPAALDVLIEKLKEVITSSGGEILAEGDGSRP